MSTPKSRINFTVVSMDGKLQVGYEGTAGRDDYFEVAGIYGSEVDEENPYSVMLAYSIDEVSDVYLSGLEPAVTILRAWLLDQYRPDLISGVIDELSRLD